MVTYLQGRESGEVGTCSMWCLLQQGARTCRNKIPTVDRKDILFSSLHDSARAVDTFVSTFPQPKAHPPRLLRMPRYIYQEPVNNNQCCSRTNRNYEITFGMSLNVKNCLLSLCFFQGVNMIMMFTFSIYVLFSQLTKCFQTPTVHVIN